MARTKGINFIEQKMKKAKVAVDSAKVEYDAVVEELGILMTMRKVFPI